MQMSTPSDILSEADSERGLLVLMGPPGSGKGTQAEFLADRHGFAHINTGALLRQEIMAQSTFGREVEPYVEAGSHIPTHLLNRVIAERISAASGNIVLDGYPRNLAQYQALEAALQDAHTRLVAVAFQLDDRLAIQRVCGRLICEAQEHVFHRNIHSSASTGVCDIDGSPLVIRQDDQDPAAVQSRLALFQTKTVPLIEHYDQEGRLLRVNASGSPEQVANRLLGGLPNAFRHRLEDRPEQENGLCTPDAHALSGKRGWAA